MEQTPIQLIKAAREAKGLSATELAEKAGVNVRSLENWEQGRREPIDADIQKLAAVFGKKIQYKLVKL